MTVFAVPALLAVSGPYAAAADLLPRGFVYLRDVEPTIEQDIRYASADNFTGKPVPGYAAAECILAEPVAKALAAVQGDLVAMRVSLVVYDCYRPAQAVRAFMAWAKTATGSDSRFYPTLSPDKLLTLGYIAPRSSHTSGGTVDAGLMRRDGDALMPLDMGTRFDVFDTASWIDAKGMGAEVVANRRVLKQAMARHGFDGTRRDWWHFRYRNEPFRGRVFNFVVAAP